MFSLLGRGVRLCDGLTRREVLRVGGLAFTGLMWPDWLRSRAVADQTSTHRKPAAGSFGKAKACILIFNYGGPSHIDMWDLKPDAPQEIRGEFKPIATRAPGVAISEHLPRLANLADQYALIRSVSHRDNDHAIGAYLNLTGYSHPKNAILGIEPPATPQDLPSLGSVVSKLRSGDKSVFAYVTLGELRHFGNNDSLGQNGGCLGKAYDPFTVPFHRPFDSSLDMGSVTSVLSTVDGQRLDGRRQLLDQVDHAAKAVTATAGTRSLDDASRRAYELLGSSATRDAFDLAKESQKVRDRYGPSHFAQNCLLARRLVESGVPMLTLYSVGNRDWDTHGQNFQNLKDTLLPPMDQGVSALLEDLESRGLLEETLVVWMGDMGRTPRINKDAGRDHWSFCYSVVLAGGGVKGGQVYGSSDRSAAYPAINPVGPADIAATIYHCLGIDTRGQLTDQEGRPLVIGTGKAIQAVLG
jgi:hypothetical protein